MAFIAGSRFAVNYILEKEVFAKTKEEISPDAKSVLF
jgi:hypothetical protein